MFDMLRYILDAKEQPFGAFMNLLDKESEVWTRLCGTRSWFRLVLCAGGRCAKGVKVRKTHGSPMVVTRDAASPQ